MSAHKKSNRIRYVIITNITRDCDASLSGHIIFTRHIRHLKKKKWYSDNIHIKKITKCVFKTIKKNNIPKISVGAPVFKVTTPNYNYRVYSPDALNSMLKH